MSRPALLSSSLPHVDGVTHRWVRVRGIDFHVAEAGSGEDVVLLLHGYPQHWYEWRHLMPALAARHRVIAPDLRGFGWSDAPPSGYLKEELADDVLALLDTLGLERVKLVGHDWGGWIGFLLCLRAPERFDRYLALNILHPWQQTGKAWPQLWRFWYQWVLLAPGLGYLAQRTRWFVRHLLRLGVSDQATWDETTLASFTDRVAEPARACAGVQLYRTFNLRELIPLVTGRYAKQRLTTPTLLLFGSEDFAMTPGQLDGYERHADDMRVELVPGCGHFIADERPELVAERALAFMA
ncbi:MAG TPA: alpha/beta hydrolase [Solirubrobacteraceae bacterium]|nr:alpha/beta hydrolase [Solirubrobacteraceae bacterium]